MNWIPLTKENKPPLRKPVLVKYIRGLKTPLTEYQVTYLTNDADFGEIWVDYETFNSFEDVSHFCYITPT